MVFVFYFAQRVLPMIARKLEIASMGLAISPNLAQYGTNVSSMKNFLSKLLGIASNNKGRYWRGWKIFIGRCSF